MRPQEETLRNRHVHAGGTEFSAFVVADAVCDKSVRACPVATSENAETTLSDNVPFIYRFHSVFRLQDNRATGIPILNTAGKPVAEQINMSVIEQGID